MRKGFTLAELLVGIAILSVMTVALFEVYSSVSLANRRLDRSRELTETVRTVTEEISKGVREKGVDFAWYENKTGKRDAAAYLDWSGSGAAILALNGEGSDTVLYRNRYGKYGDKDADFADCDLANSGACFLTREVGGKEERLTSASVTFTSLKFFVSGGAKGDGAAPGKVTLVAEVDLVRALKESASSPALAFQTTVAERPYNRNQ